MSEEVREEKNPIDCLFDESNTDPIVLYNEKGEPVEFDQIAIIPIEEKAYAILKPLKEMEGIGEDEALVFEVVETEDEEQEEEVRKYLEEQKEAKKSQRKSTTRKSATSKSPIKKSTTTRSTTRKSAQSKTRTNKKKFEAETQEDIVATSAEKADKI